MLRGPQAFLFALSLVFCRQVVRAAPTPDKQPVVTATRQNAFSIPFHMEPSPSGSQPAEVQLHVSTDQGATWAISSRVKPENRAFIFRAPHDGEYWFAIRTVDARGGARPEGALQAQLRVIVDTVAPRLDLTATRGEAGEIAVRWQAVDPNLDITSFKLESRAASATTWEPVAVDVPPAAMRHTLSGEATWWPKPDAGAVSIRATIYDSARNPAANQTVVKLAESPSTAGNPSAAPTASNSQQLSSLASTPPPAISWPADNAAGDALARAPGAATAARSDPKRDPSWRAANGDSPEANLKPRLAAQTVGQATRTQSARPPLDFALLPQGERPRMINSRSFELEYEIDSIGPSGVGKVELWGTRDGGQSWTRLGVDADKQSPMSVSVPEEGIYGFRIVVQSGSGLGGQPPNRGDLPEVWVGIDATKPYAAITGAEVSTDGAELIIRWEASDDALDPRPIALAFSAGAGQPWTPIASGLENTLSYAWRLDDRLPERIYLRLEARDEAGNVGVFQTAEPIALDRKQPAGRIREVRPVVPVGKAPTGKRAG